MNMAYSVPDPTMLIDPVMTSATMAQQFFFDRHRSMHAFIDGKDVSVEMPVKVRHSKILPPDTALPNNVRSVMPGERTVPYDPDSLDPYEFAWGSTTVDVQNDGRPDIYWVGCLYGRGGGIFPIVGSGPGRLLVNATETPSRFSAASRAGPMPGMCSLR